MAEGSNGGPEVYEVPTKEVAPILDGVDELDFRSPIDSKNFRAFLDTLDTPRTEEEEVKARDDHFIAVRAGNEDLTKRIEQRDANLVIRGLLPMVNNNIFQVLEYYYNNFDDKSIWGKNIQEQIKAEFAFNGTKEEFAKLVEDVLKILRFEAPRPENAAPNYEAKLALLTTLYFINFTNPEEGGSEDYYHRRYKEALRMLLIIKGDEPSRERKGSPRDSSEVYRQITKQTALLDTALVRKYGLKQNFNTLEQFARRVDPDWWEERDRRMGKDEKDIVNEVVQREKEDQILGLIASNEPVVPKPPTSIREKVAA